MVGSVQPMINKRRIQWLHFVFRINFWWLYRSFSCLKTTPHTAISASRLVSDRTVPRVNGIRESLIAALRYDMRQMVLQKKLLPWKDRAQHALLDTCMQKKRIKITTTQNTVNCRSWLSKKWKYLQRSTTVNVTIKKKLSATWLLVFGTRIIIPLLTWRKIYLLARPINGCHMTFSRNSRKKVSYKLKSDLRADTCSK